MWAWLNWIWIPCAAIFLAYWLIPRPHAGTGWVTKKWTAAWFRRLDERMHEFHERPGLLILFALTTTWHRAMSVFWWLPILLFWLTSLIVEVSTGVRPGLFLDLSVLAYWLPAGILAAIELLTEGDRPKRWRKRAKSLAKKLTWKPAPKPILGS